MGIISYKFVLITIVSVLVFYLLNHKYRVLYLTILSCVFIATYSYISLIYILVYGLINYYIGLKIPDSRNKILLFRTGIVLNLTQLILLKYSSFAIDPIFQLFNSSIYISKLSSVIIPIGISYYTLQGIGYLINVKMGWEKPEKKFMNFLLYLTFFPKFLSGPVERSNHFLPQIRDRKIFNEQQVTEGLRIVMMGFFKKVAIANKLAPYTISSFANLDAAGGNTSWVLFIIQPLYLYFDFSGYTDIAIGIARMFGIELLPNFQRPFFAENITTFWKRFHMSLSSWFNDYIFRQTSFKHRGWGIYASVYAVFLTWTLFGIWHGAGWNFMLIGLLQAIAINFEFFTKRIKQKIFTGAASGFSIWSGRIFTYLFYCVSLVLFFSPDIKSAIKFLSQLTTFSGPSPFTDLSLKPFEVIIYIPILLILELLQNDFTKTYDRLQGSWLSDLMLNRFFRWTVYSIMITIIFVSGFKSQQFIYANF